MALLTSESRYAGLAMNTLSPPPRCCEQCPAGNVTLEFQRHHIERSSDTPSVVTVGSLWACRVCARVMFIPDASLAPVSPSKAHPRVARSSASSGGRGIR
jgi:hypothetical protein